MHQLSVEPSSPERADDTGQSEQSSLPKLAVATSPRPRASTHRLPPGVVKDIVGAMRKELTDLLPTLLAPVLQELNDLKVNLYGKQESTLTELTSEGHASAAQKDEQSQLVYAGSMPASEGSEEFVRGTSASSRTLRKVADSTITKTNLEVEGYEGARVVPEGNADVDRVPVDMQTSLLDQGSTKAMKERASMESVQTTDISPPATDGLYSQLQTEGLYIRRRGYLIESGAPTDFAMLTNSAECVQQLGWENSAVEAPVELDEYFTMSSRDLTMTSEETAQLLSNPGYQKLLPTKSEEQCEGAEIMGPKAADHLLQEIASLEAKEASAQKYLDDLSVSWMSRCQPYENDLASLREEIQQKQDQLAEAVKPIIHELPPPGPDFLRFVDTHWFHIVSDVVVLINLVSMALEPRLQSYAQIFTNLDNMCLTWYVCELASRIGYHQKFFFIGKVSAVWWGWLDFGIVVSGVIDQWLMPLITGNLSTSVANTMRFLRLFRLMRFLEIIRAFLEEDLSWTNGHAFEVFMAGVIAFNSLIMALELDVPWAGWEYVENLLLIVYSFELALRLKNQGWHYFVDCENILWHYLDLTMVLGGALDLWLLPLMYTLQGIFQGQTEHHDSYDVTSVLRLLKIMRILRVLRLVRLLHMVKPLYTLLLGVLESVRAMQWVLILTFLILYACAIVFTNLVGRGLIENGVVDKAENEMFGSVTKSLFSLFKLMNGDTSVVEPITNSAIGQLLFVAFMVVANWAILAILTSVVSDNMIRTSQIHNDELEEKRKEEDHDQRVNRLSVLFHEVDKNGNGLVDANEWSSMLQDRGFHHELCNATGLSEDDLMDYFECLAEESDVAAPRDVERYIDYNTFLHMLKQEGTTADRRSILRVMSKLRQLENRINTMMLDASNSKAKKCNITL